MEFKIGLAGKTIGITGIYDEILHMCEGYYAEGPEDFHVSVTPADVEYERKKSDREAILEGRVPESFSASYLETLAVYRKIAVEMLKHDTFLMHGAVVGVAGEAVLFTAPSGVGKTTHVRLWLKEIPGAFIVNGDKPLLRFLEDRCEACGTPWAGKEGMQTNVSLPLRAICFVERGSVNKITPVSFKDSYPLLFQQVYRPEAGEAMLRTMELVKRLGETVPLYRLSCNLAPEAAHVAFRGLFRGN